MLTSAGPVLVEQIEGGGGLGGGAPMDLDQQRGRLAGRQLEVLVGRGVVVHEGRPAALCRVLYGGRS